MFINMTESIGTVITNLTQYTTGEIVTTLLVIMVIVMALAMMFQIPLEYTTILILPLILSCMTYYAFFWNIFVILVIYISFIIVKVWIFR